MIPTWAWTEYWPIVAYSNSICFGYIIGQTVIYISSSFLRIKGYDWWSLLYMEGLLISINSKTWYQIVPLVSYVSTWFPFRYILAKPMVSDIAFPKGLNSHLHPQLTSFITSFCCDKSQAFWIRDPRWFSRTIFIILLSKFSNDNYSNSSTLADATSCGVLFWNLVTTLSWACKQMLFNLVAIILWRRIWGAM